MSQREPKLHILFVAADFHPANAGYANAATALVKALVERGGVEVTVWTTIPLGGGQELSHPNLHVRRFSSPRLKRRIPEPFYSEFLYINALRKLRRGSAIDFILFETAEFPMAGLYAVRHFPEKTAVRVQACSETEWTLFIKSRRSRLTTGRFFRKVRTVLSTCPFYIGWVQDNFLRGNTMLIAGKRFGVVPNVVVLDQPSGPVDADASAPIQLLTLGRMNALGENQKNFARVLQAISLLRDRPYFGRLRLSVVGDGDQREFLQRLAEQLGIGSAVQFLGALGHEEVYRLQATCHATILASTYEGFSMFAIECLAHARPLLFADTGGLRELVDHGENGYRFDPLDPFAIASALHQFATEMMPRWNAAHQRSKELFRERFNPPDIVEHFLRLVALAQAEGRASKPGPDAKASAHGRA